MLTMAGRSAGRFCDGVSRRDFLRIGGLACGGLTMPQLLRAEGSSGMGLSHKAAIMVFLAGGPPHQDMFDLKPDAPDGIRGEFGRTPRINNKAGRDHWQPVSFALLAGGGMRTGQVIGSTDKLAAYPKDRPVWFQNVFATLYHNLGIDPATTVADRGGRPMALLDEREPIRELI